jgi:hypothetical protein
MSQRSGLCSSSAGGKRTTEPPLEKNPHRRAVGRDALREFIAEPITIGGKLLQQGESRLLMIDPHSRHHATGVTEAAP